MSLCSGSSPNAFRAAACRIANQWADAIWLRQSEHRGDGDYIRFSINGTWSPTQRASKVLPKSVYRRWTSSSLEVAPLAPRCAYCLLEETVILRSPLDHNHRLFPFKFFYLKNRTNKES